MGHRSFINQPTHPLPLPCMTQALFSTNYENKHEELHIQRIDIHKHNIHKHKFVLLVRDMNARCADETSLDTILTDF